MGVITPATDLAPACIWEECDLTIRLFQARLCLDFHQLFLKNPLLLEAAARRRGECGGEAKAERLSRAGENKQKKRNPANALLLLHSSRFITLCLQGQQLNNVQRRRMGREGGVKQ